MPTTVRAAKEIFAGASVQAMDVSDAEDLAAHLGRQSDRASQTISERLDAIAARGRTQMQKKRKVLAALWDILQNGTEEEMQQDIMMIFETVVATSGMHCQQHRLCELKALPTYPLYPWSADGERRSSVQQNR